MAPSTTSTVWKYITKVDDCSGVCTFCKKTVKSSKNTSNYIKHLKLHNIFIKNDRPPAKTLSSLAPAVKRKRITEEEEVKIMETPKSAFQPHLQTAFKKQLSFQGMYSCVMIVIVMMLTFIIIS